VRISFVRVSFPPLQAVYVCMYACVYTQVDCKALQRALVCLSHLRPLTPTPPQDGGLVARTKIRDKFLKEAAIKRRMAGRVQQMAQNWVESPLTELLIMLLVILDISLTVVEAGSAKAEVRHTLSRSHIRHTLSRSHMRPPSQPRSCAHPPTHYPPPAERGSL
jgi:hypothetical protein